MHSIWLAAFLVTATLACSKSEPQPAPTPKAGTQGADADAKKPGAKPDTVPPKDPTPAAKPDTTSTPTSTATSTSAQKLSFVGSCKVLFETKLETCDELYGPAGSKPSAEDCAGEAQQGVTFTPGTDKCPRADVRKECPKETLEGGFEMITLLYEAAPAEIGCYDPATDGTGAKP